MNSKLKNALMVTLLISAGVIIPAQAPLQSAVSGVATISLGEVLVAYAEACDVIGEAAVTGAKKVLATTPRDIYKFVTHPDTLAVAGVAAAGYAIYKYANSEYRCAFCSSNSDIISYQDRLCCVPCFDKWVQRTHNPNPHLVGELQELEAAFNETVTVLAETQTELAKLQVVVDGLSDTTKVS